MSWHAARLLMRPLPGTRSDAQERHVIVQETHTNDFLFVHPTGRFNQLQIAFLCVNYNSNSQLQFLQKHPTSL